MNLVKLRTDAAAALLARGEAQAALAATQPLANALASASALSVHAAALKALGRHEEALAWDRKAVAKFPASRVVWHNLAATLGDLGRGAEAVAAVQEAFSRGLDAPETWVVYGRALGATGDHSAAEAALRRAAERAPLNAAVASELAEVIWTARGDLPAALAVLGEAETRGAAVGPLAIRRSGLLQAAGQAEAAVAAMQAAAARHPLDVQILLALSDLRLKTGDVAAALTAAEAAAAREGAQPAILCQLALAQLAAGRPRAAIETARAGLAHAPHAQPLLNAEVTAARQLGEPLYGQRCDYAAIVGDYEIERPPGWSTLSAYLQDLARALRSLHSAARHPSDQSLQGGQQTTFRLTGAHDPAIGAFFAVIEAPLQAYMTRLGPGEDPLRARNTGAFRIAGAWSVLLRAGDFHRDHIHAQGWLSSAFYVETPKAVLAEGRRDGWLRFGQPPFPTEPGLAADHHVQPQPGKLVLFPSYVWHGTQPFDTQEERLTIAFDVVPG